MSSNRVFPRCAVVGVVLILFALALPAPGDEAGASPRPWERVVDWLRGERDRFADDLQAAREALLERAQSEQPELAERLAEPPEPRRRGYRLVPEITPGAPEREVVPRRRTYSLERLSAGVSTGLRDAAVLARTAAEDSRTPLEPMIAELERQRRRLRNLESNVSYHAHWQRSVLAQPRLYAGRNRLIARLDEWRAAEQAGETERAAALRRQVVSGVATFQTRPGLRLERRAGGLRVLPVVVVTDIADNAFLAELEAAVQDAFVDSPAAKAGHFRVELSIEQIPVERLYPEGVPERGARIDLADHRRRFPAGALGITTGAASTHVARRIITLGPHPMKRRVLAHEFAHLLGFPDTYLRGYQGSPEDSFGCVLVEWTGLIDDLMSAPAFGRVSEEMISRLIEEYSAGAAQADTRSAPTSSGSFDRL